MPKKGRLSIENNCCKKCNRCKARPCAQMIGHDPDLECSCKLALANVECDRPHHLPKHEKFIDDEFIGTEEDLVEYLSNAVGGLLTQDDSHFDDTTPRLEPSHPQFVNGNAVWPEGVPDYAKNVFNEYTKVCEKFDSTVETIDQW